MTVTKELLAEIQKINTTEEIKQVWDILRNKHRRLESRMVDSFYVGQQVEFDGRGGEVLTGTIEKLNSKSVSVKVGTITWRISPSLLRTAEK